LEKNNDLYCLIHNDFFLWEKIKCHSKQISNHIILFQNTSESFNFFLKKIA